MRLFVVFSRRLAEVVKSDESDKYLEKNTRVELDFKEFKESLGKVLIIAAFSTKEKKTSKERRNFLGKENNEEKE